MIIDRVYFGLWFPSIPLTPFFIPLCLLHYIFCVHIPFHLLIPLPFIHLFLLRFLFLILFPLIHISHLPYSLFLHHISSLIYSLFPYPKQYLSSLLFIISSKSFLFLTSLPTPSLFGPSSFLSSSFLPLAFYSCSLISHHLSSLFTPLSTILSISLILFFSFTCHFLFIYLIPYLIYSFAYQPHVPGNPHSLLGQVWKH